MRQRLTDAEVERIRGAVAKMTPGPWKAHPPTYNKSSLNSYRNAITSVAGVVAVAFTRGFWYRAHEMPTEPCADAEGIALLRNHADDIFADLMETRAALREIANSGETGPEASEFSDDLSGWDNSGDIHAHGVECGINAMAEIARKALAATEEKPPERDAEQDAQDYENHVRSDGFLAGGWI